jgi:hypothetical protein
MMLQASPTHSHMFSGRGAARRCALKDRENFAFALLCCLLFEVAVVSTQFELAPKRVLQAAKRFNLRCCGPGQTKPHLTAQVP